MSFSECLAARQQKAITSERDEHLSFPSPNKSRREIRERGFARHGRRSETGSLLRRLLGGGPLLQKVGQQMVYLFRFHDFIQVGRHERDG